MQQLTDAPVAVAVDQTRPEAFTEIKAMDPARTPPVGGVQTARRLMAPA